MNSHDGACAYKLIAGLYRLVCSNGLMVSDRKLNPSPSDTRAVFYRR